MNKLFFVSFLLVFLNVMDLATTEYGLTLNSVYEVNPLCNTTFLVLKIVLSLIFLPISFYIKELPSIVSFIVHIKVISLTFFYIGIIINNCVVIILCHPIV